RLRGQAQLDAGSDRASVAASFSDRLTEFDFEKAEDAFAGVLLNAKDLQERMDIGDVGLERPALANAVPGSLQGPGRRLVQFGRRFPVSLAELFHNHPLVGRVRLLRSHEFTGFPLARGTDPTEVDGDGIFGKLNIPEFPRVVFTEGEIAPAHGRL